MQQVDICNDTLRVKYNNRQYAGFVSFYSQLFDISHLPKLIMAGMTKKQYEHVKCSTTCVNTPIELYIDLVIVLELGSMKSIKEEYKFNLKFEYELAVSTDEPLIKPTAKVYNYEIYRAYQIGTARTYTYCYFGNFSIKLNGNDIYSKANCKYAKIIDIIGVLDSIDTSETFIHYSSVDTIDKLNIHEQITKMSSLSKKINFVLNEIIKQHDNIAYIRLTNLTDLLIITEPGRPQRDIKIYESFSQFESERDEFGTYKILDGLMIERIS